MEVEEWTLLSNSLADFALTNIEDVKVWDFKTDGMFSGKSLLPKLVNQPTILSSLYGNLIWPGEVLKKVNVFLWIFVYERLNTCCRL